MAVAMASAPVDMTSIDLNWYVRNFYAEDFYPNIYIQPTPFGLVYEDVYFVDAVEGLDFETLAFGGSGLSYSQTTGLTGIVRGIASFDEFGGLNWIIEDINVSAISLFSAALTPSTSDERAILTQALSGDDSLWGSDFGDRLEGFAGNDFFIASGGNDVYFGGLGNDTVSYNLTREQAIVDLANGSLWVSDGVKVDELLSIERVDLVDGDYVYDITSDNLGFGYRIYQAAFGRTPDEGGVRFWIDVLDTLDDWGWTETQKQRYVAEEFNKSQEFQALYGTNPSNYDYIDAMYQNVLFRLPDQGGYDFWVGTMEAGLTREDILVYFAESQENVVNNIPNLDDGMWVV